MTRPTRKRDGLLAAQWVARALRGRGDLGQIGLGGCEQLSALARAFLGQQRVAAHHQALAGEVLAGELEQVALIEQRWAGMGHARPRAARSAARAGC